MAKKRTTLPRTSQPSLILGAVEWIGLPDLGISRIRARVDTGAKTSALCATHIETFKRQGKKWVRFGLRLGSPKPTKAKTCEAPVSGRRIVTSSSGDREQRILIETTIHLGWEKWLIEMSLSDRRHMQHRCLLGRSALQDRALVNPSMSYLHGQPLASRESIGIENL